MTISSILHAYLLSPTPRIPVLKDTKDDSNRGSRDYSFDSSHIMLTIISDQKYQHLRIKTPTECKEHLFNCILHFKGLLSLFCFVIMHNISRIPMTNLKSRYNQRNLASISPPLFPSFPLYIAFPSLFF